MKDLTSQTGQTVDLRGLTRRYSSFLTCFVLLTFLFVISGTVRLFRS